MLELAQGMVIVAAADVFFAVVFLGVGLLVAHVLHWPAETPVELLWRFWIGWALVYALLPLWNLFFAVDWRVLALVCGISIPGWATRGRPMPDIVGDVVRQHPRTTILTCVVLVWAVNKSLTPVSQVYDAGLYHLPTIHWANTYPAVPGLGNLDGRLAFNSSSFLYIAMVNVGPLAGRGWYIANNLLATILLGRLFVCACCLIVQLRTTISDADTLLSGLLFIPFMVTYATANDTSNDLPADTTQILIAVCLIRILSARRDVPITLTFLLLCGAGITTKLSGAAYALGAVALVCCLASRTSVLRRLGMAGAVLAGCLIPWMARSVVLSGYPLFPSTIAAFPVSWRVPVNQAVKDGTDVTAWARLPGPRYRSSLHGWSWFQPWLSHNWTALEPLLPALCFALLALFRRRETEWGPIILVGLPASLGLVAWFWWGPDPRFATALLWILPAGLATGILIHGRRRLDAIVLCGYLAITIWCIAPRWAGIKPVRLGGSDHGFRPVPTVPLKRITLDSGLVVVAPVSGDQVWEAPLPSTPYPELVRHTLYARCPGNLACGFEQHVTHES